MVLLAEAVKASAAQPQRGDLQIHAGRQAATSGSASEEGPHGLLDHEPGAHRIRHPRRGERWAAVLSGRTDEIFVKGGIQREYSLRAGKLGACR